VKTNASISLIVGEIHPMGLGLGFFRAKYPEGLGINKRDRTGRDAEHGAQNESTKHEHNNEDKNGQNGMDAARKSEKDVQFTQRSED